MKENKEIKALLHLIDDPDEDVYNTVSNKIISFGKDIIPNLEHLWESVSNEDTQERIELLIHRLHLRDLTDEFTAWKESGANLLEGAILVSKYHYPDMQPAQTRQEIEKLRRNMWLELNNYLTPIEKINVLNSIFYNYFKQKGVEISYESPDPFLINKTLETKKGNPISLCCIYMIIAQQLNMPVYGVNLPNLFVLTYKKDAVQFYINVFNKGLVFMRSDIDHYIAQLNLKPNETFYQPCSNLDILKRVLRNLTLAFEKTGDADKVKEIERMAAILSDPLG